MLAIRPFISADAIAIDVMLRDLWAHDPTMFAIYQMHREWEAQTLIRYTLVATIDRQIVGVGTLFESTIHPLRLFVNMHVARQWQRQGIGTAIYHELTARGDERPWTAKITRRDSAGLAFLRRRGFKPVISTLLGTLEPQRQAARDWMNSLPDAVAGYHIAALDDPACTASRDELVAALESVYRQFHEWNSPAPLTLAQATSIFYGADVIPGSPLCITTSAGVIGASVLYVGEAMRPENEVHLGNFGIVGRHHPDAIALTAALLRHNLEFAATHGFTLRFEADDTYIPQRALFENAPAMDIDRDFIIVANG